MPINKTARVGSTVEIEIPAGLGIRNGRTFQEYKKVRARVYIVMPTHLVCATKGREASPYCAETYKLIKY